MVTNAELSLGRRNASRSRRRILEAAADEFAARGFAGARVDRIAALARVNKRMLYHYFGDKRGLLRAVLTREPEEADSRDPWPPMDRRLARLRLWALLEEPKAAADPIRMEHWCGLLEEAQRAGRLPPGLDCERLAALLLWGQVVLEVAEGTGSRDFVETLLHTLAGDGAVAPRSAPPPKPRIRLKPQPRSERNLSK